jgi:hypothetical protein
MPCSLQCVLFSLMAVSCASEAGCRLGLEILEVGKCGEEGCRTTRDLVNEVLLKCVGMVQELFKGGREWAKVEWLWCVVGDVELELEGRYEDEGVNKGTSVTVSRVQQSFRWMWGSSTHGVGGTEACTFHDADSLQGPVIDDSGNDPLQN